MRILKQQLFRSSDNIKYSKGRFIGIPRRLGHILERYRPAWTHPGQHRSPDRGSIGKHLGTLKHLRM